MCVRPQHCFPYAFVYLPRGPARISHPACRPSEGGAVTRQLQRNDKRVHRREQHKYTHQNDQREASHAASFLVIRARFKPQRAAGPISHGTPTSTLAGNGRLSLTVRRARTILESSCFVVVYCLTHPPPPQFHRQAQSPIARRPPAMGKSDREVSEGQSAFALTYPIMRACAPRLPLPTPQSHAHSAAAPRDPAPGHPAPAAAGTPIGYQGACVDVPSPAGRTGSRRHHHHHGSSGRRSLCWRRWDPASCARVPRRRARQRP